MPETKSQIIIIFGGSGDLTKRKLIPSLFHLYEQAQMPKSFAVIGVGRTDYSDVEYRRFLKDSFQKFNKVEAATVDRFDHFLKNVFFQTLDTEKAEEYTLLRNRIEELQRSQMVEDNILYYLATPPSMYETIPACLQSVGLNTESENSGFRRIIIEKPFGYNLPTAQKLQKSLSAVFSEEQVYRIDHYLGKETAQNILVMRFANGIFEPLWNRNYIDKVEITAIENLSLEGRGGYYENAGALRDMVQNHLIQLVALVAMEPPANFNADNFRSEVAKLYQSLRPMSDSEISKNVVRGQYISAETSKGSLLGYREEKGVNPESRTETYLAMRLFIDNFRWKDVPFYIRTGKQMPTKVTEIVIHFKPTSHKLFEFIGKESNSFTKMIIRIQPDEGVQLRFGVKIPGSGFAVRQASMDFMYENMAEGPLSDAYSRLILDAMEGDSTLFTRTDAVEASWKFFDPVLKLWETDPEFPLYGYPAGSWGPKEADALISDSYWTNPCKNLTNSDKYCLL